MGLEAKKYEIIRELVKLKDKNIIREIENIIKRENEENLPQEIPEKVKRELNRRLNEYRKNPDNVIDWSSVKNEW